MLVTTALLPPRLPSPCNQAWIGQCPLQTRHTNQKMNGRLHVHMKCSDTSSSDSISLKHRRKIPRRDMLLATTGIGTAFSLVNFASAGSYPSIEKPIIPRYYKTASGVKIEDVVEGEGPVAHEGDKVELNYVCRRSNGYFVHSTVDQINGESKPVILPVDDKQIIAGLKEVLVGMRAGGKRRALIPPDLGYTSENLEPQPLEFGPRRSLLSHVKEALVFEVQVLKVL